MKCKDVGEGGTRNKTVLLHSFTISYVFQDGDISCATLPQFSYGKNASIDLKLTYCSLAALECLPRRLQASSVRQLQLYATAGTNVTKEMVNGMDLETFFLYGDREYSSKCF